MKKPSKNPIKLECSLSVSVTSPIEVKTDILINANETPTVANNNLNTQKSLVNGITKHIQLTSNKAVSIDFLIPIFGRNEARMKEHMAIGRSLKPSKMLAEDFEIPKFCCTCRITVPTEFRRIAKTK
ncbi:hypothetical protein EMIT036CA2_10439 [Chryseobacterium sp. IT-36CA2]